ncbi:MULTISPECIES: hypothetical protein [Brachybacterium]|uniref:Uncharacterized protein n=1 Tax=Brachybacterium conglomeratum TaxID=47846 RepID=A0ABQ5RKW0_9MICO|nr:MULTISPECIES: hypothetical protein [Brachybacterium]GLI32508.1 hypothetical protein BCONGLO52_33490 [Brachybacterium conglomeratum]GLK06394.1 hypothetical protein GCM10017597_31940 [Brachybacterium conglomeratum]
MSGGTDASWGSGAAMRRRSKGRARFSRSEGASLFLELFDLIAGVAQLLWRLPLLILRLFS